MSKTIEALGKIKVKAGESNIPSAVKPLLTRLKQELVNLISETINDETNNSKSPNYLKVEVASKLGMAGITLPDKNTDEPDKPEYTYDEIQDFTIETPPHHSNLLVVTTTLWVMCGQDTSFYIFKKEGRKWNLVLAEEANDYNDILGAHSWFGYSISPPDKKGRFYVVTANVNPWCTSNWQGLRYTVYRPGQSAYNPKILLKEKATIYLGIDPPVYKIKTSTDKFRLEFNGDWYATPDTGASPQYVIYGITGNNIELMKKGRLNR
jgi:hypothetical protein